MKNLLLIFLFSVQAFAATAGFPGALGTETTGNLNIGAVQVQKGSSTAGFPGTFGTETTSYTGLGAVQRVAGAGPLTAGSLTIVASTVDTITVSWTSATGGTAPITAQLQKSPAGAGTWSNVSGATSSPWSVTGLSASTSYDFRVVYTDAVPTSVNSSTQTGTTAATAVIAITSPSAYQVIQRSGLATNLTITGTYTGTPTSIEAKWGNGPWTTIVASPPAAGPGANFSGTLQQQFQGQGTLQVRFVNDNTVTDSKANVGIGLVLLETGQSNAVGLGLHLQTYTNTLTGLKACLFGNDYAFKELVDPYDSNVNQVDSVSDDGGQSAGSWAPLLATELMNYFNCPVMFVPAPKGSTSVTAWQPGATHTNRATLYGSATWRGMLTLPGLDLWWQGETDAANGMDQATYNSNLEAMANATRADLGIRTMPFVLQTVQLTSTETGMPPIRAAIRQAFGDNTNTVSGVDLSDITADEVGGVHVRGDAQLLQVAQRIAEAIKPVFFSAQKASMF